MSISVKTANIVRMQFVYMKEKIVYILYIHIRIHKLSKTNKLFALFDTYISQDIHEFSTLINRLETDPTPIKGLNL